MVFRWYFVVKLVVAILTSFMFLCTGLINVLTTPFLKLTALDVQQSRVGFSYFYLIGFALLALVPGPIVSLKPFDRQTDRQALFFTLLCRNYIPSLGRRVTTSCMRLLPVDSFCFLLFSV